MFIFAWLLLQILQANHIIIPALVGAVVGWGAFIELFIYIFLLLVNILSLIIVIKK